jgi:hypothetical protein
MSRLMTKSVAAWEDDGGARRAPPAASAVRSGNQDQVEAKPGDSILHRRLEKRHKRHVLRARQQVNLSQIDVRTPEQLKAARGASRRITGQRNDSHALPSTPVKHEAGS